MYLISGVSHQSLSLYHGGIGSYRTLTYNAQTVQVPDCVTPQASDNDGYRGMQMLLSEREIAHLYGLRVTRQSGITSGYAVNQDLSVSAS